MAEWSTAYVNDLPDSSFAYIESGGKKDSEGKTVPRSLRHYPHHDASGKIDLPHLRNALSRVNQEATTSQGKSHLQSHAKSEGVGQLSEASVLEKIRNLLSGQEPELPLEIPIDEAARFEMLTEVGRVLSSTNERTLRTAMEAIAGVLSAIGATDENAAEGEPATAGQPRAAAPLPKLLKKMLESADLEMTGEAIPLVEALRPDGTVPIKIISPGWGTSGYYSPEVLKEYGPKAYPKGTHMHWDHPTVTEDRERPERSLNSLAAVFEEDASFKENGPKGPGLYTIAKVRQAYREPVDELAPHIGTSIRTRGEVKYGIAEGRRGRIVQSMMPGGTVDFVTTPGRGGEVLQLFEAARDKGQAFEPIPGQNHIPPVEEDPSVSDEELREAAAKLADATARAERAEGLLILTEARTKVSEALKASKLPDFVQSRLVESISANPATKDGKLDEAALTARIEEAVKEESAYIAKLTGSGRVHGMGESSADLLSEAGNQRSAEEGQDLMEAAFRTMGWSESEAKIAAGRKN